MKIVRKENLKTLIIASDREFRQKAIQVLNVSGFHAEKVHVESTVEAQGKLANASDIGNIIIDADIQFAKACVEAVDKFLKNDKSLFMMLAIVYATKQELGQFKGFKSASKRLFFKEKPIAQHDLITVFHNIRAQASEKKPEKSTPTQTKAGPSSSQTAGREQGLVESIQHLKVTIDNLDKLMKNPSDLNSLATIAQRFNGLMGTYSHFQSKDGYSHLCDLATKIEDVARAYTKEKIANAVKPEHGEFLLKAAKLSFHILQQLRKQTILTQDQLDTYNDLVNQFQKFNQIQQRETLTQDDVDNLVQSLQKPAS